MHIRNLASAWLIFAGGCVPSEPGTPTVREVRFAPYLTPCPEFEAYACLVDLDRGETYPFSSIHGLAFEWGVSQRVRLVRHVKENPRVDTASWAWDADTVLMRATESIWSFRTTLSEGSRWTLAGDTLRIEGYGFPIAVPIVADRDRLRTASIWMIFELEVTPGHDAGEKDGPALQAKVLRVRERAEPG